MFFETRTFVLCILQKNEHNNMSQYLNELNVMVNLSWLTLTQIKILHINQHHLLKNLILSSQQELDRQLQIFQALFGIVDISSRLHNLSRKTECQNPRGRGNFDLSFLHIFLLFPGDVI